ncbi:MAG: ATP-binding protein [Candidatus Altiarchaeota archaeon]|nr:ATP-binding protein [Candidatus Altiarchaeota archaeon]
METKILENIIKDQKREIERKFKEEKILKREYVNYTRKFLEYPNILAILGVRRGGKSIFSLLLSKQFERGKEKAAYINFDDERLIWAKTEDLNKILQVFYGLYGDVKLIILDEVQNIEGWELFANRLRRTKKVIITGSNSRLLSGELATHLTGRYIDHLLYPFSFRETLDFKPDIGLTEDNAKIRKKLQEYIEGSGFPEYRKFGSEIISRIYRDIISKDCINRYKIRDEETFRELANYLISNFSGEFTYSKLSRVFGIKDVHTTKNYVSYIRDAFLIVVLERFSPKLKQQVIAPKKVYAVDQGLCNFISFKLSKNQGKIFENIVCIDLLREKSVNSHVGVYYWKDHQGREVDFVVKEKSKIKELIQVCYDIEDLETKEREINALIRAGEELRCNNLTVVTDDYEAEETTENQKTKRKIRFIPLWRWLLREKLSDTITPILR